MISAMVPVISAQAQAQPQAPTASLTGRVLDPAGAVVPGATVTVESAGGTRHTVTTNPSGVYSLPALEPGRYTLTVSLPAFREARATVDLAARQQAVRHVSLEILPVEGSVTVEADAVDAIRATVADHYNRNKTVTAMEGKTVVDYSPVANYDALRLLPGVMSAGQKDRFSAPSHLRGAGAWGQVEQVDDYPSINITPVSAEDGGYTASFSSIIPSLALNNLTLATGGLGVSYGQASGGIVRSGIKRGSARGPRSTIRVEGMGIGEGVLQADTGGVIGNFDYYAAGQTVQGDYGDKFATYARPMDGLSLFSGLVKAGYKVGANGRAEALVIAGDETHDYYTLAFSQPLNRNQRRDFHTDKSNVFAAARYDQRPSSNLVFGAGITHNRFHENRIEDTFDGTAVGLSRRNRPQQATRVFANGDYHTTLRQGLTYNATVGVDLTWDRYRDITTTPLSFSFREQSVYYRNSLVIGPALTINAGIRASAVNDGFKTRTPVLFDGGAAYALPTKTLLKASYSTGYKVNKAFFLWWGNGLFIQRPGSEGLRPSKTDTLELGVEQTLLSTSRSSGLVRVSYYRTDEVDLFNFGNTGNGVPFYDDARIRGTEVWSEWRFARVRPFGSFTWLRTERTRSTNPAATNVDLRFTPLPNYAASFGTGIDVTSRLYAAIMGNYDGGGVSEQVVNDDIAVTRFESFVKVNASANYKVSERITLTLRLENLFNARDLGYSRSVLGSDGSSQRITGTQRDPGTIVGGGLQVRF